MTIGRISIKRYFLKRTFQAIPLILVVIIISFIIIHTAPGDPIEYLIGETAVSEKYIEITRARFGLDKPIYEQLIIYIKNILQGDLGYSYIYERPVLNIILETLPNTLILMGTQLLFSAIIGIILGVIASRKPYSIIDNLLSCVSMFGFSMPVFWVGQMLILILSLNFDLFPVGGIKNLRLDLTGIAAMLDYLHHLFLPALALCFIHVAVIYRLTRTSMLEELGKDYIITARAKGLDESVVLIKHGLRNALLPVVTILGLYFGFMFAGAIMTETVFSWPGIGRLTYDAINMRDYPIIMGVFIGISIMVIITTMITDLLYAFLDPRVKF